MTEAGPADDPGVRATQSVFVSYATSDRKQALAVCEAIERRGIACWISTRDVAPGANYQEAIVQALRAAPVMILVFSEAANNSEEIKKELSLASRFRVPVIAIRIADVEPSDAFAYELSTRQWIDAFTDWDRSIDVLAGRIGQISGEPAPSPAIIAPDRLQRARPSRRRLGVVLAASLALVLAAVGGWWWLRPPAAPAHGLTVRLAGFKLLSADLPVTMRDAVDAEISAAFNADGVVGVSTAAQPEPGTAPAYALGGTIQRDGSNIRVITRLTNERSGATVWGNNFNYVSSEAGKVPRHIAVDTGNVVRCGLFGATTYRKPLPDSVLRDYMQFCEGHWDPNLKEGRRALVPAQRVVAAVPDFSWGWAAVAGGYWKVAGSAISEPAAEQARAAGREAADRAIALDSKNSEALYIKAMLVDPMDWLAREQLFKRAVAARRLDCGCEYHQYGKLLLRVGRIAAGVELLRQANDMLALYVFTALDLAEGLALAGQPDEAKSVFAAAIDLAPDAEFASRVAMWSATRLDDATALLDTQLPVPAEQRAALTKAYGAAAKGDSKMRAEAVRTLLALPSKLQNETVARLLAKLGAVHEAFQLASMLATHGYPGPSLFWDRDMRATLDDPDFPALATRLNLIKYWKATRTKPDVCNEATPPAFCRAI